MPARANWPCPFGPVRCTPASTGTSSMEAVLRSPSGWGGLSGAGGGAGWTAVGAKNPAGSGRSTGWRWTLLVVGPFTRALVPTLLPGTEHRLDVGRVVALR